MYRNVKTSRIARNGLSLIETLLAASVMAIVLVPALSLMKSGLKMSRDVETADLLTTLCVSKMEQHLAMVSVDFSPQVVTGDFSSTGQSEIRYRVDQSDSAVDGGLEDRLMVIAVTVWQDTNGDAAVSDGELEVTLHTKVAAMAVYESQFGGS